MSISQATLKVEERLITRTLDLVRAREAYEVAVGDPQCLR